MAYIIKRKLKDLLFMHPKPAGIIMSYGRNGFLARADTLPWIMIRIGLLAALRSKVKQACVGVMITASHYPEHDNGVKIIDPDGETLDEIWEVYANQLAMIEDNVEEMWTYLDAFMTRFNIQPNNDAIIGIAHDTRKSGLLLTSIVKHAAQALYTTILDFELMTTPQLHYAIRCFNQDDIGGRYTEVGYFDKIYRAFVNLVKTTPSSHIFDPIVVDAANGVGALKLANLRRKLGKFIQIDIFNNGTKGSLNENCGVDYIKLYQKAPTSMQLLKGFKYCSIDGAADRLIYFFIDKRNQFQSLVGDRFSALYAFFFKNKLSEANLVQGFKIGVVQTPDANGGSTVYITHKLEVPVVYAVADTKCLRQKAHEFDIGIYFEANGHGTVHFSENFKNKVNTVADDAYRAMEERRAANQIRTFMNIINEIVGDAIANLFATEAILFILNFNLQQWLNLYNNLPQQQLKISDENMTMIQISNVNYRCISPIHLQDRIDGLVSKYSFGRAFIRPAEKNNTLIVYAEAATQVQADKLAEEVRLVVEKFITTIRDF